MILFWLLAVIIVVIGFTVFFGAPYVPTRHQDMRRAFDELYDLKPTDVVLDLGSGDGSVLVEVAKRGARAVGYEIHPILVFITRLRLRRYKRASVRFVNLWKSSFPDDTTLVYVFSDSRDARKMANKINEEAKRLGRQLVVLSYGFELPGMTRLKKNRSHFLYTTKALQ